MNKERLEQTINQAKRMQEGDCPSIKDEDFFLVVDELERIRKVKGLQSNLVRTRVERIVEFYSQEFMRETSRVTNTNIEVIRQVLGDFREVMEDSAETASLKDLLNDCLNEVKDITEAVEPAYVGKRVCV